MPTNEFRVFISSTFRDLQEEREHLVKKIFPEIRALCRERGIIFTEVDLRWGLTDEDVMLGQVIRACLEEIDRCRPYFIGITGERYGYVPTITEIYKDPELLRRFPWVEDAAVEGSSIIDLEFRYGAIDVDDDPRRARFYFRRDRESLDTTTEESEERRRLENLKERVRSAGYPCVEFRDAGTLGEMIYDDLVRIIREDFASVVAPSALDAERARHAAFAGSRRHAYIPNSIYLSRLGEHVAGSGPPLVVYAESGSGKSALLAHWAAQHRRRNPDAFVVEHYVGIGAGAVDHLSILRHVMLEIRERYGLEHELPANAAMLVREFPLWLGRVEREPMILLLDGLNQLQEEALSLSWLPRHLPPNVRLVVTSTIEQTLVELRARGWETIGMQPLTVDEREAIVVRFLAEYHKSLSADQVRRIASDTKCAHPLFLRTLLEELRLVGQHESIDRQLGEYLATTGTEDLFQQVLGRLEEDFGARSVREVMSTIWASRSGLSEAELVETTGLTRLKISTLVNALDYHLIRRDGLLTFFHDYLRRAVEKRYMAGSDRKREVHGRLAEFFRRELKLEGTRSLVLASERIALELPFQCQLSGDTVRLREAITSLSILGWYTKTQRAYELLRLWMEAGGLETMENSYREALRSIADRTSEELTEAYHRVGWLLRTGGRLKGAEEFTRIAIEMHDASGRLHNRQSLERLNTLANIYADQGEKEKSSAMHRENLERRRTLLGHDDIDTMWSTANVAISLRDNGQQTEAIEMMRQALDICTSIVGPTHRYTAWCMDRLGEMVVHVDRAEGKRLVDRAYEIAHSQFGDYHHYTIDIMLSLATIATLDEDYRTAERWYRRALDVRSEVLGVDHPHTINVVSNLAMTMADAGDLDSSIDLYTEGLRALLASSAPDLNMEYFLRNNLACILVQAERLDEAEAHFKRALELVRAHDYQRGELRIVLSNLGDLALRRNDLDAAQSYLDEAFQLQESADPNGGNMGIILCSMGELACRRGDWSGLEKIERGNALVQGSSAIARSDKRLVAELLERMRQEHAAAMKNA